MLALAVLSHDDEEGRRLLVPVGLTALTTEEEFDRAIATVS